MGSPGTMTAPRVRVTSRVAPSDHEHDDDDDDTKDSSAEHGKAPDSPPWSVIESRLAGRGGGERSRIGQPC
jgi:hypothetical protein